MTSSSATFGCVDAFDMYLYLTRYRAVSRVLYLARERGVMETHSLCAKRMDVDTRNRMAINPSPFIELTY